MSFRFSLRHNRRYLTYALMRLLLMSLLPASSPGADVAKNLQLQRGRLTVH